MTSRHPMYRASLHEVTVVTNTRTAASSARCFSFTSDTGCTEPKPGSPQTQDAPWHPRSSKAGLWLPGKIGRICSRRRGLLITRRLRQEFMDMMRGDKAPALDIKALLLFFCD